MAGYSGNSMSNNAIDAYGRELLPASKIYKGLPAKLVTKYCRSEEWHHTSAQYNETSFYNPVYVKATFGVATNDEFKSNDEAISEWNEYKQEKKREKTKNKDLEEKTYENCIVNWGKSFKGKWTYYEQSGCKVVVKGILCKIFLPDGSEMRKKKVLKIFLLKHKSK